MAGGMPWIVESFWNHLLPSPSMRHGSNTPSRRPARISCSENALSQTYRIMLNSSLDLTLRPLRPVAGFPFRELALNLCPLDNDGCKICRRTAYRPVSVRVHE